MPFSNQRRRRARLAVLCVLCGLAFTASVHAQVSPTAPPSDLSTYVAATMKTFSVPGLALAIVKDGKIVVDQGYGVRKIGDPTAVDEHTMFGIGSNTKVFTTAALAMLVDAGKLSWDDPVYQRLPGFVMYDPYVSHEMTVRDLLTQPLRNYAVETRSPAGRASQYYSLALFVMRSWP